MKSLTGEKSQLAIHQTKKELHLVPKLGRVIAALPDHDTAICLRIREVREALKWKQRHFAERLGIPKARLASYEYARAPVRYQLAKKLCVEFQISLGWLATGRPPISPFIPIAQTDEAKIRPGERLSEAYPRVLRRALSQTVDAIVDQHPGARLRILENVEERKAALISEFVDVADRLLDFYKLPVRKRDLLSQQELATLESRYSDLAPKVRNLVRANAKFVKTLLRESTNLSAASHAEMTATEQAHSVLKHRVSRKKQ